MTLVDDQTGSGAPDAATTAGRLVDRFERGPGRAHLPDLGADLRLQPGLRALPVQLRPSRPRRADHRRVQGADRRVRARCRSSTSTSAAASPPCGPTSGSWWSTPPTTTSASSSRPTDRASPPAVAERLAGQRLRGRADLPRRGHRRRQRRRPRGRLLSPPRSRPWNGWPTAGFAGFKLSVVVTRHNVGQLDAFKALADRYGAQLRLTRLRPSGRGADVWDELHPTAGQQRILYDWLVAHGEDVLTGDSFFHLAGYGEALPGLNLCGAGRVVCLVDPVGDVYACPFAIHDEFLAGNVRSPGGFAEVWRHSDLFTELRRPQSAGACGSCGHYDACRGGCMAAKFFTGLPLDGPDPECVLGHGEHSLAARGPADAAPAVARPLAAYPAGRRWPSSPAGPTGPATRARWPPSSPAPPPAEPWPAWSNRWRWPARTAPSRVVFGPHETNLGRGRGHQRPPCRLLPGPGGGGCRRGGHRDGLGPPVGLALRAGPAGRAVRARVVGGGRGLPPPRHPGAGRAGPLRRPGVERLLAVGDVGAVAGGRRGQPRDAGGHGAVGHRRSWSTASRTPPGRAVASGLDGVEIDAGSHLAAPPVPLRAHQPARRPLRIRSPAPDHRGARRRAGRPRPRRPCCPSGCAATSSPRGPG